MQPVQERSVLLIPLNRNGTLYQDVQSYKNGITGFSENEPVTVRVLSILKNNTIRIAVKGTVLQAQIKALSQDIREGAFLLMRVHITGKQIVLTPYRKTALQQPPHRDMFTQLGIPQSGLAAALLTFFRQNEQPLQSRPLLKILSSLPTFAPHEKKAAFAAALLYSRGIEPSQPLISQCLAALFGLSAQPPQTASDEPEDLELFRFLNHVKTGRNHWIVFPFEKQIGTLWKGSAAFLLDLHDTVCLECCIRIRSEEKRESWIFTLRNNECLFCRHGQEELPLPEREKLTVLLHSCLKAAGAHSYIVHYAADTEQEHSLASIDISV